MVGKLWWNLVFALMGALMVYILSIGENTLSTTAIRSSGTFILFFLLLFFFRWAIGYASENRYEVVQGSEREETVSESELNPETSDAAAHTFTSDEQMLNNQSDGETESQNELSEEEAKKTSEMIRSLLDDDE